MELPTFEEVSAPFILLDDEVKLISEIASSSKMKCDRYELGFTAMNNAMNGGFKDGDLVIISGVSGHGKTSVAQTMTYNLCRKGISCLWFSYEVSIEHLHRKFLEMGISEFYTAYAPKKNTTGKLEWIKGKIRESWAKYATKVIFIDHIDFLAPNDIKTGDNETIALKKIATELKSLAIELNVTIVVMAHLKKIPDGKEPDMQDIGYSAGIFQLADYVFMIFREKNKDLSAANIYAETSILKLVKNRETGKTIWIRMQYNNSRFLELSNQYGEGNFQPTSNVPKF